MKYGHKNINSLSRYTTASLEQQKHMCQILQGQKRSPPASFAIDQQPRKIARIETGALLSSQSIVPHSESLASTIINDRVNNPNVQASSSQVSSIQGIFAGATFSNISNFHIHVHPQ